MPSTHASLSAVTFHAHARLGATLYWGGRVHPYPYPYPYPTIHHRADLADRITHKVLFHSVLSVLFPEALLLEAQAETGAAKSSAGACAGQKPPSGSPSGSRLSGKPTY